MSDAPDVLAAKVVAVTVQETQLKFLAVNDLTERRATALASKEPAIRDWIGRFEKPCVFWDIGANVGIHAIYAATDERVTVFAFEPNAANHFVLSANAELNQIGRNFNALCVALSDRNALGRLCSSQFSAGASFPLICDKLVGRRFSAEETVLACTIDSLVGTFGIPVPQYIKIDVPTVTDELLTGARATLRHPGVRQVFMELDRKSFAPGRYEATLQFMDEAGFHLEARHQKKKLTLGDYLFVRR